MESAGALDVTPAVAQSDVGAGEFSGGNPPQENVMEGGEGGVPQEQQPVEPEFQFELPSGSRYRTLEDLQRGATEKDFTIERMKAELAEIRSQGMSQQVPQAPPVDPQAEARQAIEQLTQECFNDLRSDPMFAGASQEDLMAEARLEALRLHRSQRFLEDRLTRQQREQQVQQQRAEWRSFVDSNWNELNGDVGRRVFEQARAEGREFKTPMDHLNAVHAEMYRMSRMGGQPQAGGTAAVQGAIQNQNRPLFGNATGTGGSLATAGVLPERVQQAVEHARTQGFDDAAIERVKQRAMENESRFRK